jgi:hypothetical protein
MSDVFDPDAEHSTVNPQASVEDELDQADETVAVDPASLDASPTEDADATPDTPPSPDRV